MTNNTTGFQWVPKPPNGHVFKQPTQRFPPFPGTENHPSRSDAEPALKRQKLDPLNASPIPTNKQSETIRSSRSQPPDLSNVQTYNASSHTANQSTTLHLGNPVAPSLVFPLRLPLDQHQRRRKRRHSVSRRAAGNAGPVQSKPFVLEPPSVAPRYPSTAVSGDTRDTIALHSPQAFSAEEAADFTPWRGIHPEDALGEFSIKHGFYDKIQVSQNESGTARPTAWRNYKQQSGLNVLSSLFVSVLDQRQIHGFVTAGCTFKPPPRVTLTDSKREAWLRDLADPKIPLRRLSRTIPHGIRGRALLDHSLAKNIPTSRSIWLAKCVGANEIRAVKRKGATGAFALGGESKWIKDWTANVEQFLDTLIGTCGSDGWREKMTYGLQLATHLFAECLLDRDHYFDWLLSTISQIDLETLPLYLVIIRSHLREFGQCRRYGRRLAESLLEQLHKIENNALPDLYSAVKIKTVNLITVFLVTSPASFLMPRRWLRYQSLLRSVTEAEAAASTLFNDICKRNMRLLAMAGSDADSEEEASQSLIELLNSLASGTDIFKIAPEMWEVAPNAELLVRTCLCWSTSIFSNSWARIYIAVRLLRSWRGMGLDIQTQLLQFLAIDAKAADLDDVKLYRVIAELIRSGHFSVVGYLNWVIANGLSSRRGAGKISPTIGLLTEIPSDGISVHTLNLRRNLLRSIGVDINIEDHYIAQWQALFDSDALVQNDSLLHQSAVDQLPIARHEHTLAVKLNVGHWIRQKLVGRSDGRQTPLGQVQKNINNGSVLDECQFGLALAVLEKLEDYATLGDLLLFHSKSHDPQLLRAIAVTTSHYLDILQACGTADMVFIQLMQQHIVLHSKPGYLALVEALNDLAASLPNRARETRTLRKEKQKQDSKSLVTACSPISEHMAEALQIEHSGSALPCTDDIEQLLASGTSMDKQLLTDVFGVIWRRFEIARAESVQSGFTAAGLLVRLRSFDATVVAEMTIRRIDEALQSRSRTAHQSMWISLVCAKVISFEKVMNRILQASQQVVNPKVRSELLAEIVECLTLGRPRADCSITHLYYRFYAQQQRFLKAVPPSVVSSLQGMLKLAHSAQKDTPLSICKLLQEPSFTALLRTLSNTSSQGTNIFKEIFSPVLTTEGAVQTLGRLTLPSAIGEGQSSNDDKLHVLFDNVTTSTSLSLHRLYLEAILTAESKTGESTAPTLVHVTLKMLPSSSSRKVAYWASIVSGLPQQQRQAIGDKAETEIFVLLASTSRPSTPAFLKEIKYLLSLVSVADYSAHNAISATRLIIQIYNTIVHLSITQPSSSSEMDGKAESEGSTGSAETLGYVKLYAVLRLLHIHHTAFCTPNVSEDAVTELLVQFGLLLGHPFPNTYSYLSTDICDFLTTISDSLSATIHLRCIRILKKQYGLNDSLLHYIFASSDREENAWLQLSAGTTSSTQPPTLQPFPIRIWETMQDATPLMTENDTSISLSLFGARKTIL
ncbi:MAG: hypothetical protein Q9192_004065 [Flavoplaca navasiana]